MRYIIILVTIFCFQFAFSQSQREIARQGNRNYHKCLYSESEVNYRKSLSKEKNHKVQFNLSDALFKQNRYDAR